MHLTGENFTQTLESVLTLVTSDSKPVFIIRKLTDSEFDILESYHCKEKEAIYELSIEDQITFILFVLEAEDR